MNAVVETRFSVQGMKCNGCITRAREALAKVPGFKAADFDLDAGIAVIEGDADPQVVAQTLTDAGYPATVKGD